VPELEADDVKVHRHKNRDARGKARAEQQMQRPNRLALSLVHPVSKERVEHSLANADGSFLSRYHLRKHLTARDRVCAGNARIEIGRTLTEKTFVAGPNPMKSGPRTKRCWV
jgi:hypothetical protein